MPSVKRSLVDFREEVVPLTRTHCVKGHEYTDANTYWALSGGKRYASCRTCRSDALAMKMQDPEYRAKQRIYRRDLHLRKTYGISLADESALFEQQAGLCAICGVDLLPDNRAVDHDHVTGAVRGLLCLNCNTLLGMAADRVDVLQAAISYLGGQ